MDNTVQFAEDKAFAERVIAGDAEALREFYHRFQRPLASRMVHRAGTSHAQLAIDASDEFLSECVAPSQRRHGTLREPRLTRFDGSAPLDATLFRWCLCKFLDKLRHERVRVSLDAPPTTPAQADDIVAETPSAPAPDGEQAIVSLVHSSVARALEEADQEGIVLMRLAFLHHVPQNVLAETWGVHPSQIGRRIKATLAGVQKATMDRIHRRDATLEITWEDILHLGENTCELLWDDVSS